RELRSGRAARLSARRLERLSRAARRRGRVHRTLPTPYPRSRVAPHHGADQSRACQRVLHRSLRATLRGAFRIAVSRARETRRGPQRRRRGYRRGREMSDVRARDGCSAFGPDGPVEIELSVIVPLYNEEANVRPLADAIRAALGPTG